MLVLILWFKMTNIIKSHRPKWTHTGAILAGGKSKRMGLPKPDILLTDGRSMLEHVLETLSLVCKQIVIVGEWKKGENEKEENKKGIIQIADYIPGLGPLEGIGTLLSSNLDSEYLIVACDQPFLTTELLLKLVEKSSTSLQLFNFEDDKKIQPFPGYYPVSCLSYIKKSIELGKNAMHEFIRSTPVNWIQMSKDSEQFVKSINTPEELQSIS